MYRMPYYRILFLSITEMPNTIRYIEISIRHIRPCKDLKKFKKFIFSYIISIIITMFSNTTHSSHLNNIGRRGLVLRST